MTRGLRGAAGPMNCLSRQRPDARHDIASLTGSHPFQLAACSYCDFHNAFAHSSVPSFAEEFRRLFVNQAGCRTDNVVTVFTGMGHLVFQL